MSPVWSVGGGPCGHLSLMSNLKRYSSPSMYQPLPRPHRAVTQSWNSCRLLLASCLVPPAWAVKVRIVFLCQPSPASTSTLCFPMSCRHGLQGGLVPTCGNRCTRVWEGGLSRSNLCAWIWGRSNQCNWADFAVDSVGGGG